MTLELTGEEVEALRDLVRQRLTELEREINHTDRREFKHQLQQLDRTLEGILARLSAASATASRTSSAQS
jgi:hypothetical protein